MKRIPRAGEEREGGKAKLQVPNYARSEAPREKREEPEVPKDIHGAGTKMAAHHRQDSKAEWRVSSVAEHLPGVKSSVFASQRGKTKPGPREEDSESTKQVMESMLAV